MNTTTRYIHLLKYGMAAAAAGIAAPSFAQSYPARPIRLVVPFSVSGITDIMARLVAQRLTDSLGQQVVVDNRAGAAGIGGTDIVAKAPADGYTLLMTNVSYAVNLALYAKLPYDTLRDFTPITMVNSAPLVLVVHPAVAAKTPKELVALAKARPGQLNYGSGGVGSTPNLAMELFKSMAGVDIVHIPYKGFQGSITDLMAGQLAVMIENLPATMPLVKAGKLRALAVSSAKRSPREPDLPTISEAGVPGYEVIGWNGMMAVSGTPRPIVQRLSTEIAKILHTPEVRERLTALGAEAIGDTPEQFGAFIRSEISRWGKVIKERGIRAE